jgi:predicted nucleic acid-binding protein
MRTASHGCLVDTNILVYPYDPREHEKGARALSVLAEVEARDLGLTSAQILGELFVTLRRLLHDRLDEKQAAERVHFYAAAWPVCEISARTVFEAIRAVSEYSMSYWDALIWATARQNRVRIILTEDGQTGREIEGVLLCNPLVEGFNLQDVL